MQARGLQPQPDASRGFGGIIGNQHPVGGFDAICRSIGIGHSDPAWDGGHRERPKRHEAMWRAMAGRQGCGNNERRNLAAVPRPMTSSTERRQRTGSNTLHIRASSGPASADGSNLGGRNQDLEPVQRGVRGQQGGDKGGGPDEARFRSRLQSGNESIPTAATAPPAPAAAPSYNAPAPTNYSSAPAPAPQQAPAEPPYSSLPASMGAGEFASDQQARARCPTDTVVWVNTRSRVYHFAGTTTTATLRKEPTCASPTRRQQVTAPQ